MFDERATFGESSLGDSGEAYPFNTRWSPGASVRFWDNPKKEEGH
jgi:hypothetical protein